MGKSETPQSREKQIDNSAGDLAGLPGGTYVVVVPLCWYVGYSEYPVLLVVVYFQSLLFTVPMECCVPWLWPILRIFTYIIA